jgi:hypothetical protein
MSRKVLIIAVALLVIAATSGFALGMGLAFGLDPLGNMPANVLFSVKFEQFPFLMGLGFNFDGPFRFAMTADWWLVQQPLGGMIDVYAGPGFFAGITSDELDLGLRIPLGLSIYPIAPLELFVELAPAIRFMPVFPEPGLQSAFGFRFWF